MVFKAKLHAQKAKEIVNKKIKKFEEMYFDSVEKRIDEQDKKIVESGNDYYVYD